MKKTEIIICLVAGIGLGITTPTIMEGVYVFVGFVLGCILTEVHNVEEIG